MTPRIVAVIPHYYECRIPNLQPITNSLVAGGCEVLIWNNDAPLLHVEGAHVVYAPKNYGCQGRFVATQECLIKDPPDYVLFHDNDLLVASNAVQKLLGTLQAAAWHGIATITGERRLFGGQEIFLSRGRYELMAWDTLQQILQTWKNDERSLHDDLWLSVRAHKLGIRRHLVHVKWRNIDDNVGMWKETPNWETVRQQVFEELMRGE